MRVLTNQNDRLLAWSHPRNVFNPRPDALAIGWGDDEIIRAVCIFDAFSDCDVNVHITSDGTRRWLSKEFLFACFAHPFLKWDMRRITGLTPAKNKAALAFNEHIGWRREGYIRHALPDDDIVLQGMLRSECRWIPENFRRHQHGR